MDDTLRDYEDAKQAIYVRKKKKRNDLDEFDDKMQEDADNRIMLSDALQVGTKIVIGGGAGLLAGVATIAIAASAAEVVVAGVITKIAGVVGGAIGLSLGLHKFKKTEKSKV